MVKTRSTPLNQRDSHQNQKNAPDGNDNEVPADFNRRGEGMTEGVIWARKYPAPGAFDHVGTLSNVGLFARAPWVDTVDLDQDGFWERYETSGLFPRDFPLRAL